MASEGSNQAGDQQQETQAQGGSERQEEVKPDIKPDTQHLTLTVAHQDGSRVPFKVKVTTLFDKLFKAYCTRKSLDANNMVFITPNGDRINGSQTPADFDLEDGDTIEAQTHQVGG